MKRATIILALLAMTASAIDAQKRYEQIGKYTDIYNAVLRELTINYVDTFDYEKITQAGISRMLQRLDPYTTFFAESDEEQLKIMTTGIYGGIGSTIMQRGDYVVIWDPYEGMPAQRNDIHAGDTILKIDGKNVKGLSTAEVSKMLRGLQGTEVELTLKRNGQKPLHKKVVRAAIQLAPINYYGMITDSVGYIAFGDFTENSFAEFRNALADMSQNGNMRRLVIDLRNNGGGLVSEAVEIASLFVPKNTPIVSMKGLQPQNQHEYKTQHEPLYPNLPLVVMIDASSASASEILAGSLQDLDRAVIVGERSFGKGLVQNVRTLPHNTHMKITTAKYYIPSGRCVQAIDYAKRDANGSLQRIPDSLTHEFATANGRKVRDGGGITPDVTFEQRNELNIVYFLYIKNIFFDYATRFAATHKSIAPAGSFALSDEDYADFVAYARTYGSDYKLQSAAELDEVVKTIKEEGYYDDTKAAIEQLTTLLQPDIERDLARFRTDVEEFLGAEIVKRYYFQRGAAEYGLHFDKWLHQAVELVSDDARCRAILGK